MTIDSIPIIALFALTIAVVVGSIELGYRMGRRVLRRSQEEKEAPVSAIVASVLGLLAFILAFTFGMVADRYDARKGLVREEANAIGTAYLRSDFLQEPARAEAAKLFPRYVDLRVSIAESHSPEFVKKTVAESTLIQARLWDMAVANARRDMNSDVGALYIEALNAVFDLQSLRLAVSLHSRIPAGIWLALYILIILSMTGVGYHTAIAGSSRRSWITPIVALAFSLVIAMIVLLDRPQSSFLAVSQQPLLDVRASMNAADFGKTRGISESPRQER